MDEMTEPRFSASKRLERGLIVLPEEIDHAAYEFLVDALDQGRGRALRLYCRGMGGSAFCALAMVDLIAQHGDVTGLLPGVACSAHGLIWAACQHRYVFPNGRLGIHKIAYEPGGLKNDSVSLDLLLREIADSERQGAAIYAAASNKTAAQWRALMERTGSVGVRYLDAGQLVTLAMARPVSDLDGETRAAVAVLGRAGG